MWGWIMLGIVVSSYQGFILPPCPLGHGQGGFSVHKKHDERFQSNATSNILAYLSLGQQNFDIKTV